MNSFKKYDLKIEGADDFFKRGRDIARLADQGKMIPRIFIMGFEDPEDMAKHLGYENCVRIEPPESI